MSELIMLPVERLYPHPDNPRKDVGDVSELAESIRVNGILQNLTVVPINPNSSISDFRVIIGHRRLAAAKLAGLESVPCAIVDMSERDQLSTMLTENMQRADLTVYEQAQGFQMMLNLGCSMDEIAEKSGFSRATVKRRLKMMELDQDTLKKVSGERQLSLTDFDKLAQIEDIETRNRVLEKIGTNDFTYAVSNAMRSQEIERMTPLLKKLLKASGAKAIKSSEKWSSKYERVSNVYYYKDWDGQSADILPKVKGQLFYCIEESYGNIELLKEAEKKKQKKRPQKEIDREKRIAAAWEEEKELTEITRKLRSDFVQSLSVSGKNITDMLKGAVASFVFCRINYTGCDRDTMMRLLNIGTDIQYDSIKRSQKAKEGLASLPLSDYAKLIYANYNDDGKDFKYTKGYSGEFPKHNKNAALDALYDWLCSLGYQMSEIELQLRDGTHPLFSREEGSSDVL